MNILIYVLDSLRPDHLSCYGYHRPTSPALDRLARDAVLFENAFAQATWTRPSAASLLTGAYPDIHQARTIHDAMPAQIITLPERLAEKGWKTCAFSAMGNVSSVLGFDRGFQIFHDLYKEKSLLARRTTSTSDREKLCFEGKGTAIALPLAEDINRFVFPTLDQLQSTDWLLFIWAIDTHDPYAPPRSLSRFADPAYAGDVADVNTYRKVKQRVKKYRDPRDIQFLIDLYDDEIVYADHHLGLLLQKLKDLNLYDDTIIIVTGDHGDGFNDYNRGRFGHGGLPYEETLRVPLICKLPGSQGAGARLPALVQLVDIAPTVLDCVAPDQSPDDHDNHLFSGTSLLPLIDGHRKTVHEYVYSETQADHASASFRSLRGPRWKYIQVRPPRWSLRNIKTHPRHFLRSHFCWDKDQLYDLQNDRGETVNLARRNPALLRRFQNEMETWQRSNLEKQDTILTARAQMDRQTEDQLRCLGYM